MYDLNISQHLYASSTSPNARLQPELITKQEREAANDPVWCRWVCSYW